MKSYRKFFACMLILVLLSGMMSLIVPVCLQIWDTRGDALNIHRIVLIVLILVGTNVVSIGLILYRETFAQGFNEGNARTYLSHMLHMKYDHIIEEGPTNLLEKIVGAVNHIYEYMTGLHIQIWSSVIIAIASICFILQISWILGIVMLLYIPITYVGFRMINTELTKRAMTMQQQTGKGFQELMSYINEPDYYKQLTDVEPVLKKMEPALHRIYGSMAAVNKFAQTSADALSGLGTVIQNVILIVVVYYFFQAKTSPYTLMLTSIVLPLYFESVRGITNSHIDKKEYLVALDFGKQLQENREAVTGKTLSYVNEIGIALDRLHIKDQMIPFHASVVLKKGDIARVHGESGSGKSTFAKALVKFREVEGITINGVNLSEISNAALRSHVEYISQNIPIIRGTLRENLMFGKEYLDIPDTYFLHSTLLQTILCSKQLDDDILEGGANLSGGEKQKIAIVRALISEPEVLILDEVCSNIDAGTTNDIYDIIKSDRETRITILITHDELPDGFANIRIN